MSKDEDPFTTFARMVIQHPHQYPSLERVLVEARDAILHAVLSKEFKTGTPAFDHPNKRIFWVDGWPVAEWLSCKQIFHTPATDDIVALRIFDAKFQESIHWFVQSADRRRYDKEFPQGRPVRSRTPTEEQQVENPIIAAREARGHAIRRQVICPAGRIDIFDVTANEIIECKARGSGGQIVTAVTQLRGYSEHYPGARLTVAVPFVESDVLWLVQMLRHMDVGLIEIDEGGGL